MEKRSPTLHEKIQTLRGKFLDKLPQTLEQARRLSGELAANPTAGSTIEDLYRAFHTIKGSASSFDFAAIAATGEAGETAVRAFRNRNDTERRATLGDFLAGIDAVIAAAQTALDAARSSARPDTGAPAFDLSGHGDGGVARKRIFLCDDDTLAAEHLAGQLACFGYKVVTFPSTEALRTAVLANPPDAVVMDIMFPDGSNAGTEIVDSLRHDLQTPPPVVFLSARRDFEARLGAVRAGGQAYFTKPVKPIELVETLDSLTQRQEPEPYRILVVDDEEEIGQYHSLILEEAGMTTRILTDPSQILDSLAAFKPDLVLMDVYMPTCTGRDLSRIIRQIPDFISLPIVFLSSETDKGKQVSALKVGAEGFLTKPIQPEDLISAVAIRAERMRTLRSLMVRDSLTGLFNHTFLSQYLDTAMAGARRENRHLSLAMLDVDHFKTINDTFGHPAGDQVLVALARLLQQRLRGSDMISRYGGEEFAIVMQGSEPQEAQAVIDALRDDFSKIRFTVGDRQFSCTFSGGIAGFPEFQGSGLLDAADHALYEAKKGGRNRIHLAPERGSRS